ncbi:MAG: hypothetical protein QXR48_03675 [Candidatus Woesearchaeota archaeon]
MYSSSVEPKKDFNESDTKLAVAREFCGLYHNLAEKRDLGFARAVLENAFKSNLDYSTTKLTLEAALSLLEPPKESSVACERQQKSNHIESLPEAVALVYALTPEKTKECRVAFLNELKNQPYVDMQSLMEKALRFYFPQEYEIKQYVASLPAEGHALILKSNESRWDNLAATFQKYRDLIIHFSRIESQFKVRLRDYLPASSGS